MAPMTETAIASDDGGREVAALRAEVAALREDVAMLRAVKLGVEPPADWQQVIYPGTAPGWQLPLPVTTIRPWTNVCAGAAAPPMIENYVVNTACAGPAMVPYRSPGFTSVAAGGYGGQVYTVPAP